MILVFTAHHAVQAFDELDEQLAAPEFTQDFRLTVGELFSWLME